MSRGKPHIVLAWLSIAGCYAADFDTDASAVFVCSQDDECPLGQACSEGLCQATADLRGPSLAITSPAPLKVFSPGDGNLPLAFEGQDLLLAADESEEARAGYVEVYLDGALVDAVTAGDLEAGLELASIPVPATGGLHHVVLSARHQDGERFDNPEADAHVAFWVDDGREHVAIVEPPPGARFESDGARVQVEIASLNFTLVNPGFVAPGEPPAAPEGYVHIYVDADVPSCLPACNFDYQSSIIPPGLARVNQMTADQYLVLPDGVGTVRVQIVAQALDNEPYYRSDELQELVYDEVPVQSVVGEQP